MDETLLKEAQIFAERLNDLIDGVFLEEELPRFRAEVSALHVRVSAEPIPLVRQGTERPFAVLAAHFNCDWSSVKGILAVRGSSFMLRTPEVAGPPVLQFDYQRDMESRDTPVSHINVSSQHRGLLAMIDPEGTVTGEHAQANRTRKLHLPTGGHRFRPSLEDVLHMLITEFDLRRRESWRDRIALHRAMFREFQTSAAVRDHPRQAKEELEALGYEVAWIDEEEEPGAYRAERLTAF